MGRITKICELCEEESSDGRFICPLNKRICKTCIADPDKCDWDDESESCWEKCEHPFNS